MTDHDDHIQHTWNLTRDSDGDRITIDLWTDGYSVRVDGGPDDGHDDDRGRQAVEQLLAKYTAAGYRLVHDYAVNDPATSDDGDEEPEGADQRPDTCPECGTADLEYVPNHCADFREGPAWLCTGCRWGQWIVA
ncbi:hypothetical protein ACIRJM_23100 [Streptomyces sp. NPDC102405]|uniref:hypothetical protein n=1 Tax=Streptomyces sp. NPDC102405 TaxID=3366170 RepID=UPI0038255F2C